MCLACEEEAMFWRYQLEIAVERGEIPEGFEPADSRPRSARAGTARAVDGAAWSGQRLSCDSPDPE